MGGYEVLLLFVGAVIGVVIGVVVFLGGAVLADRIRERRWRKWHR